MSQVIYRGPSINRVKRLGLMMSTVPPGKSYCNSSVIHKIALKDPDGEFENSGKKTLEKRYPELTFHSSNLTPSRI